MQKLGVIVLMAVLGAIAAVAPAYADSDKIAVNIPFDFVVGNAALKAGEYKIEKLQSGVLELRSEGQPARFALIVEGSPSVNHQGDAYVVFNRYGNQTFLSKVALSADGSYDLLRSNREKLLNKQATGDGALIVQPAR
jgi:hypothetical protein